MLTFLAVTCLLLATCGGRDLASEPGHLKPFGAGRPVIPVEEMEGFPNPRDFFENYVTPLRPLKMKNAAKMSSAFLRWTDDYFLKHDQSETSEVKLEAKKATGRQDKIGSINFREFIRTYNESTFYMVDEMPGFFRSDLIVPCPIQCSSLMEEDFADLVIWFSSGGTKSVVHNDVVDNINCLFRGDKTFVLVDPDIHDNNVNMDGPDSSHSMMDVDRVDYTKYPGMADVEFYHVNVTAGDCIYIPYRWLHQVRSYGSNLATNFWWRHHLRDFDSNQCNKECDSEFTSDKIAFTGFVEYAFDPINIRSHIKQAFDENDDPLTFMKYAHYTIGTETGFDNVKQVYAILREIYKVMDTDKDGVFSKSDFQALPFVVFEQMSPLYTQLDELISEAWIDVKEGEDVEEEEEGEQQDGIKKQKKGVRDEF